MVQKLVGELLAKKIVLVPMALLCQFLIECEHQHVVANGGAFSDSFTSQYMYL